VIDHAEPRPADPGTGRRRRRAFAIALVVLNLAVLEGCAYVVARVYPQLISDPEEYLHEIADFSLYQGFIAKAHDAVTGWENVPSNSAEQPNCLGEAVTYTTDANGARRTPVDGAPRVLVVGDSFTHGYEVGDLDAWPAQMARSLDVPVANYGVSGFDPWQATLLLEEKAALHPAARVAVLGVMYENIRRLRTGFRYVMHISPHAAFQYKPWLDVVDGEVRPFANPNAVPVRSRPELVARATEAFRSDYYAPEPARFPYVAQLVRGAARKPTRLRVSELLDPMYGAYYADAEYRAIMLFAVRGFIETAREHGLRPLVFFMPRDGTDRTSAGEVVATIASEAGEDRILDAGTMPIDWARYNLRPNDCHPSPYGHEALAAFAAPRVRAALKSTATPAR